MSASTRFRLPGAIGQIGYVVADIDQAIESWLALGVGPWYVLRGQPQRASYRGSDCAVTVSIAFANSGDLQLELIQQLDDTPSIYTEFLAGGPGGFHQFAWFAEDFDAAVQQVREAGYTIVWSGGGDGSVRFAYFEPPAGTATIIELCEYNAQSKGLDTMLRTAAANWDGSDPVRSLNG